MPVLTKHRFNTTDYYRMAETGVLREDARVELLDGEIIDMSPIGPLHGGVAKRLIAYFSRFSHGRWIVSAQDPVHLDDHSEPQPDLMLLRPLQGDYTARHPEPPDVFLLIEVADTSVYKDREVKLPGYAAAGISEVWIVNVLEQNIEVHREPFGTGYNTSMFLRQGDKASPLAFPDAEIDVAELLKRE